MRKCRKTGFTLVEILIVVVILGILAAIVVPQFTSASNEAIKGALQSQLQTINTQIELFRVREQGDFPDFAGSGWDELTTEDYLKEEPVNGYTGEIVVDAGGEASALAADRDAAEGWFFEDDDTATDYYTVYAAGYDETNDLLAHEEGFGEAADDGGADGGAGG